jgi:hypothetical protein
MKNSSSCPALNRYHSFSELVNGFSSERELRERYNAHGVRTMLDLGMCVPLSGFQLHLHHHLQCYEGYDAAGPSACLSWFQGDFPGETGKGVAVYLAERCGVDVDLADRFLGANHIAWAAELESAKYDYRLKRYDLIVMSNSLHYLKAEYLRYVLRRVKAVCDATTKIYMLVKDNTDPMKQAGMTKDDLLTICSAFANEHSLHAYPPIPILDDLGLQKSDGSHHLWTNI